MSELDVVLSKINIIKNCLMALEKTTKSVSDANFQISIYEINLQRAIQACIEYIVESPDIFKMNQ